MHDLITFQNKTGQEPNGIDATPGFVDAANGEYALNPGSDLIDAGILIPGINDDYSGPAPDIGAYEHISGGTVTGDLNDDGAVNIRDALLWIKVVLGTETDSDIVERADVNEDGSVDRLDLMKIVSIIIELN